MPWGIVAGAAISAIASRQASKGQSDAANRAAGMTQAQFDAMQADLQPYVDSGGIALDQLNYLLGLGPPPGLERPEAPTREQFMSGQEKIFGPKQWTGYGNFYKPGKVSGYTPGKFDQAGYDAAWDEYQRELAQYEDAISQDPAFGSLLKPFSLDDFWESPSYQFNLSEGMNAINKSAAARGDYYAPATLADLGKRTQDIAGNELGRAYGMYNTDRENIFRRLSNQQDTGLNAAAMTGKAGLQSAQVAGNFGIDAANADAAGLVGVGNAINRGIGDAYSNYLQSQVLQQSQSPTYGAGGYSDPNRYTFDSRGVKLGGGY